MRYWYTNIVLCVGFVFQVCPQQSHTIPATFGKTNFIIGGDTPAIKKRDSGRKRLIEGLRIVDGHVEQVFFSPDDNVQRVLLDLIKHEQQSIKMAAFLITDTTVAHALIAAHRRGVQVEIMVDKSCVRFEHGKALMLVDAGIDVQVYKSSYSHAKGSNIMHNKFIVFGKNILDKAILWTGSFNFTRSAHKRNQENTVVLDSVYLVDQFIRQFNVIRKRCIPCRGKTYHTVYKKAQNSKRAKV